MYNALIMIYILNDIECLYNDLECFMLSSRMSLKHVLIYIWLSSSSERGRSMDDQVLDLALMTNYSQSTFMWTVASPLSVFA